MIVAKDVSIHLPYGSGNRSFIRIHFKRQTFPSSENKILCEHISRIKSIEGNIDFFCLGADECPIYTNDGLFLAADGEISFNKITYSAFAYYQCLLEKDIWMELRSDAFGNLSKKLLIYFSHLYGKVDDENDNDITLKVKLGFEKIVWCKELD
jgi:hypothetical protein